MDRLGHDGALPGAPTHVELQNLARTRTLAGHVGHPDADAEARRVRAAGDDAAPCDRIALPSDAAVADDEGHEPLRRPRGPHGRDGRGPDEPRRLLAAPPEAGLDRPAVLAQVVAVEVVAGLQAQG